MKIIAVIVTHNRLALLKKSLQAVCEQTRKPDEIIVINNGSTDATEAWLSTQPAISHTQENGGGAGGFAAGIELAYRRDADWIWLMDDDSIPNRDALEALQKALDKLGPQKEKVGFLSSHVVWKDGNPHELNKTYRLTDKNKRAGFAFVEKAGLPLIQWGTFVSMLLSAKAVKEAGLPIRDFFIWCDDMEYARRIVGHGLAGIAVDESVVLHDTPTNHRSNVLSDPESAVWKYRYGLRNELYTKRLHEGEGKFWLSWTHRMFIMPFRILLNRKDAQWTYIKLVWNTSLKALSFRPRIEYVEMLSPLQAVAKGERAGAVNTVKP